MIKRPDWYEESVRELQEQHDKAEVQYEKFGFSWKEHDSRLYRGFEVMDGGRSIAMVTAFKAKEEIKNG